MDFATGEVLPVSNCHTDVTPIVAAHLWAQLCFKCLNIQHCNSFGNIMFTFWRSKGSLQKRFLTKFGILSHPTCRPPLQIWDSKKKMLMFILHSWLFWAYYFFMKKFIFLVGTTNNLELGGPRPSWIEKILLPHLCIVCFITFLAIYQGKFVFGKFQQKLGLQSDPPAPCWAKCPTFSENEFWGLPLF